MGRQFNYYISPEEEKDFAGNILKNGFLILAPTIKIENGKAVQDWNMMQLYDDINQYYEIFPFLYKTYIYKREWGELRQYYGARRSPVIEHCHCKIHEDSQRLLSGRFYLDTWHKDEIESFDIVYKAFQKLVRLMKKNIVYKSFEYQYKDERKLAWPASQKAVDLIESGYGWYD